MRKLPLSRLCWLALRASTALALTIAPYHVTFDGIAKIGPASAYAHGEGSGGGGGDGGGGGGDGGDGGDDHGGGDNSGPGGDDDHDNSGPGGDDAGGDDNDHNAEHINATTGDKIEVDGNKIEVTHPDGTREEIENGRFEMKDALGRTIVERPATAADLARLQGL